MGIRSIRKPDQYDFEPADRYVEFGDSNHMFIVGHKLVWHNQTPRWVFQDEKGKPGRPRNSAGPDARPHSHCRRPLQGRIDGWDVVNEALNDDGTLRESPGEKSSATIILTRRISSRTRPTRRRTVLQRLLAGKPAET